jgi:hypothetical protein
MSELREAIARAIWEAWRMSVIAPEDYRDFSWEELCDLAAKYPDRAPGKFREVALIEADAALAAIEARGMVVVPKEPTEAMTRDGRDAHWRDNLETVDVYRAMIAAASAET